MHKEDKDGCLAVVVILLLPALLIWALNVLFPANPIPYGIKTWFASFIICLCFGGYVNSLKGL